MSSSTSKYLIKHFGVSKKKIQMLYNPVELSTTSAIHKLSNFKKVHQIQQNQKVILFVGRFHIDKGYDKVIKSFEIASSKRDDLVLIMNGQYDKKLNNLNSIKENDRIVIIGPQKDINHLYQIADAVVLPSKSDSFPYVMLGQVGVHKKPFIGGNTGGIAEFIEDGENGLVVDPENPQVLAEKIIYLLFKRMFRSYERWCNTL